MPGFERTELIQNSPRPGRSFKFWPTVFFTAQDDPRYSRGISDQNYVIQGVGRGGFPEGGCWGCCFGGSPEPNRWKTQKQW